MSEKSYKEIVDKVKQKIPQIVDLSPEDSEKLNRALTTLATNMFLVHTLDKASEEYRQLDIEMNYAKTTISSIQGLKWLEVQQAAREVVEEVFQYGVRVLLSSLL